MSPDSELRSRLAARRLPYTQYRTLCEWLGVYQYIPPDQRVLLYVETAFTSASECFTYWKWLDYLESTLTLEEQQYVHRSTDSKSKLLLSLNSSQLSSQVSTVQTGDSTRVRRITVI